jgi:hypothetical protein
LAGRHGLRDRFVAYANVCAGLAEAERVMLTRALREQNEIAQLLSGQTTCQVLDDMPAAIRPAIRELFTFAFKILGGLGVRDHHYQVVYGRMPYALCPFCSFEFFDAPGAPREALDHYLLQSKYPFAAANLRNLVPMGNKCNSRYKLAQDILYKEDGARRRSIDPYGIVTVSVSLAGSQPFAGKDGKLPAWTINFNPDSEESETWDSVFQIRDRYRRDVLDVRFNNWLEHFASWCRSANIVPDTDDALIDALRRYTEHLRSTALQDGNFLRGEVFDLFRAHCEGGDDRSLSFMRGIASLKLV